MTTKKSSDVATVPPPADVTNPFALIHLMVNKGVSPDALKQMMDLAERHAKFRAEMAFDAAMNRAQASFPTIAKDAWNDEKKKAYSSQAALEAIKPVYTREGFALSFTEEACPVPNLIRLTCHISHAEGDKRTRWLDVPMDGTGLRGNANMTPIQAKGSTLAYARRYLTFLVFNLVSGEDDDEDGNQGRGVIGPTEIGTINELIEQCTAAGSPPLDRQRFLRWALQLGDQQELDAEAGYGDIPLSMYGAVIEWLTKRLKAAHDKKAAKEKEKQP